MAEVGEGGDGDAEAVADGLVALAASDRVVALGAPWLGDEDEGAGPGRHADWLAGLEVVGELGRVSVGVCCLEVGEGAREAAAVVVGYEAADLEGERLLAGEGHEIGYVTGDSRGDCEVGAVRRLAIAIAAEQQANESADA